LIYAKCHTYLYQPAVFARRFASAFADLANALYSPIVYQILPRWYNKEQPMEMAFPNRIGSPGIAGY
jgi:hypothetical protein